MLSPSGYSVLNENEDFELSAAPSPDPDDPAESRPAEGQPAQKDPDHSLHSPEVSLIQNESMFQIALEMLFPFILAGIGMVLGMVAIINIDNLFLLFSRHRTSYFAFFLQTIFPFNFDILK